MGDHSPVGTALREGQEELGIEPGRVDVWGKLHCFPDRQRTNLVTPVIGCLDSMKLDTLKLNSSEVHATPSHRVPVVLLGSCRFPVVIIGSQGFS